MDHVFELLLVGVGLLLVVIYILSATGITKTAMRLPEMLSERINGTTEDISESRYLKYCHNDVNGSDVVTAVRKFKNDNVIVEVTIYTSATNTVTESTLTTLAGSFQNLPTNTFYINPTASFKGEAVRNANDVIEKLVFTQNSYVSLAGVAAGTDGGSLDMAPASVPAADAGENAPEIMFSDEGTKNNTSTEDTSYLKRLQNTLEHYTSDINDAVAFIEKFDITNGSADELINTKNLLAGVQDGARQLKAQYSSSKVISKEQKVKLSNSIDVLMQQISNALVSVKSLQEELQKYEDTNSVWFIGYPVASDVKAELSVGTLTISGKGKVSTGTSLPKWLKRSKEIKKVVVESGVTPKSMDYWFEGCLNLGSINRIPSGVQTLNGTFNGCKSLKGKIKVESTEITSINAFQNCGGTGMVTVRVKKGSETEKTFRQYLENGSAGKVILEVFG